MGKKKKQEEIYCLTPQGKVLAIQLLIRSGRYVEADEACSALIAWMDKCIKPAKEQK